MTFTLVRSQTQAITAQRTEFAVTGKTSGQSKLEHGLMTGETPEDVSGIAIVTTSFTLDGSNEAGEPLFTVKVDHQAIFRTEKKLQDKDAANADIMAPMMHAATGMVHAIVHQTVVALGVAMIPPYPQFKATFERDNDARTKDFRISVDS